jgi:photosystem II stability/assembly factor-like uncharacterized protein
VHRGGWGGLIVRTADGGATWTTQSSGTTLPLLGVFFHSDGSGTSVGYYGTIVRTTDKGVSWTVQAPTARVTLDELDGISCPDVVTCTAVGGFPDRGTIVHTADGGATWMLQTSGTTHHLRGVSCVDANTCTAVGESGTILHTTDGGATWTAQSSGTTDRLNGVSCPDTSTCTAVGGRNDPSSPWGTFATILGTTDGGATWNLQAPSQDPNDPIPELFSVSFTDANTGTTVGANGFILRTYQGGADWGEQEPSTTAAVRSVSMTATDRGMAAADGAILSATAPGTPWTQVLGEGALSISCIDANTCTTVGSSSSSSATILGTTTGGQ